MAECAEIAGLIGPYIFGDLDQAERAAVEEHLASHLDCRRYVAQAQATVRSLPVREPTAEELDAIVRGARAAIPAVVRARRMHRRLLAAVGVAAVLVIGTVYLGLRPKSAQRVGEQRRGAPGVAEKPESGHPGRRPAAPAEGPQERHGRGFGATPLELASLGEIVGHPQVRRAASALWLPAESKQQVSVGDQVRTGPRDRISLGLSDGTRLVLQPGTTLALQNAKGRPAQVRLLAGQVDTWVAPGTAPFLVQTRHGRAQATGTRFAVDASPELTTVAVFDGRVQLGNDQGRVTLDPRTQGTLRAGEPPSSPTPLEPGPMMNGAPGVVTDTFDGPILNRSMWILRTVDPGIYPVQEGGALHITGITTGQGLEVPSGLATHYFPRQSFSISVDVRIPNESELGPFLQLNDNSSGEHFEFTFSREQGYATSGHTWSRGQSFGVLPPFGDEAITPHTMRLTYDEDTATCSADVDGQPVGSIRFQPEWLYFFLGLPLTEKGHAVHVRFANFRMYLRGASALPRIQAPSQTPLARRYPSPVLWLGAPDSWESMAVYAPYVIKVGNRYLMYYAGHQLTAGWMWSDVGLATSDDGIHWQKYAGNPVLADAGEPCVLYDDFGEGGRAYYRMYYRKYLEGSRDRSVIALATSPDGIHWTRQGQVLGLEPSGERVSDPNVLYQPDGGATGDRYLMYYYTKEFTGDHWIIGVCLATSNDGVHFERRGWMVPNGSRTSIDGLGVGGGQVLRIGATYHMWYTARSYDPRWRGSVAHAVSPDGFQWTKVSDPLVVQGSGDPGDVFYALSGLTVLREGDTIRLWYGAQPYELYGAWETLIGYAEYQMRP